MIIRMAAPVVRKGDYVFMNTKTRGFLATPVTVNDHTGTAVTIPLASYLFWLLSDESEPVRLIQDDRLPDGVLAVCVGYGHRSFDSSPLLFSLVSREEAKASVMLPEEWIDAIRAMPEPKRPSVDTLVASPTSVFLMSFLRRESSQAVDACCEDADDLRQVVSEIVGCPEWEHRTLDVDDSLPNDVIAWMRDGELVSLPGNE